MPTFNVTAPTGETYRVNAPEGATEAQAIAYAQTQHAPAAPVAAAPKAPAAPAHPVMDAIGGASATLTRALPFLSEAEAYIGSRASTLADVLSGKVKTFADPVEGERAMTAANDAAFQRIRARQQGDVDQFKAAHPVASNLTTGVGLAGQVATAIGTDGASAAPQAAEAQAGIRAALARFGGRTVRAAPKNATIGAGLAAVNAAAQPGDLGDRVAAADKAIIPGAAAGIAIPAAFDAASGAVRHVVAPAAGRMVARVAPGVTATPSASAPEVRAAQAIQNAIERDAAAGHVIDPSRPLRLSGGENVAALYDVIAQSPGPGRQLMRDAIDAHARDTSAAIRTDLGNSLGGQGDYFANQDALQKARAANAKPDLEAAFAEPIGTAAFDEHLGPIMARLPKGALAAAQNLARMDGEPEVERGLAMLDSFGGHSTPDAPLPEKVAAGDLKAVASGARPKLAQGPSLLHFISKNGGLSDEGGELAAMDAGTWHKGGPFRSKLIRPDGLSLDAMAEKANSAGYFPNTKVAGADTADNYHTITGADLHAAIQDELAGRPVYSREPSFDATVKTNRLDSLEERIRKAGLTARGLTPKDAGIALGHDAAETARLEAHAGEPNVGMSPNVQADAYTPTLKVMHYLKKGIDQTLEPYRNDVTGHLDLSGSPDAQAQSRVRTDLGRAMRRVSPAYDKAMASWGDDSDGINALKLGRNVFSPKFDMQSENLARVHADMSDEAKAQYQKGVGEAIIAKVRQSGDIRSVRQLLGDHADEFRARVALAFQDPEAFGQFVDRMQGRVSDAARDARFRGGSPTYGRAAARADLEQAGTHPLDMAADVVSSHPARLAGKALAATLRALPRGTPRSAIMDPTANAALGRSASNPAEVTRLLTLLRASRRVSGAPRLQGPAAVQAGRLAAAQVGAHR